MRVRRLVAAASLAAFAVSGLAAGPVAAYSNVTEAGLVGPWSLTDTSVTPGATCSYGPEYPPNYAGFRWMKVKPPTVYAADRNSGRREHRMIEWYWKLQRAHYPNDDWTSLKTSAMQFALAYDDQPAQFTGLRINKNVGNPSETGDVIYRAKVFIKWLKKDGTVEGTATATIDFYTHKVFGTEFVAGNTWCQKVSTTG
jgi:hypothetical protein